MDATFWLDRWTSGQIGFHESNHHPMLLACWPRLELADGARVFVPLCGKSNDLVWLRARGHEVVGIELSEIAVKAFFAEQDLDASIQACGNLQRYTAAGYTLYCGDYFQLEQSQLGPLDAVYDRAALIALPPAMRGAYASHLTTLASPHSQQLLITVDYDQTHITPPPFVVTADEVATLYPGWRITELASGAAEVKGQPGRETALLLTRTSHHD